MKSVLEIAIDRSGYSLESIADKILFDDQIFMGAGNPNNPEFDFTGQQMALVHHLVNEAFSVIGGMQQNGLMGYEFCDQSHKEDERKLSGIVENIRIALLGK